jgi:hypothetical protein
MCLGETMTSQTTPTLTLISGSEPAATGGAITNGDNTLTSIIYYNTEAGYFPKTLFQINAPYYHRTNLYFSPEDPNGSPTDGDEETGTFLTTATGFVEAWHNCNGFGDGNRASSYTATGNAIQYYFDSQTIFVYTRQ